MKLGESPAFILDQAVDNKNKAKGQASRALCSLFLLVFFCQAHHRDQLTGNKSISMHVQRLNEEVSSVQVCVHATPLTGCHLGYVPESLYWLSISRGATSSQLAAFIDPYDT